MSREAHVRICEGMGVRFPCATRLVAAFETEADARRFRTEVEERLKKFKLSLAEEKTRVIPFHRRNPEESFVFLGFEFRWGFDRKKRTHLKRTTAPQRFANALQRMTAWCRENRHTERKTFFPLLQAKLRGHYNYYGVIGNGKRLKAFFERACWIAWRWLRRRNSRGKLTWESFRQMLNHFHILTPKITERAWAGARA